MKESNYHKPVLLKEAIDYLHIKNQGLYIDATLGAGGHSIEIIKRGGRVLGLDDDLGMIKIAREKINLACPTVDNNRPFKLLNANFRNIKRHAIEEKFLPVDGILFDLGISSLHYDQDTRGFSFNNLDKPLDMRLNQGSQTVTAADLVNSLRADQLTNLFSETMVRSEAARLARLLIEYRQTERIETVGDFLLAGRFFKKTGRTHPATKAFLALRIAVNTELENLKEAFPQALSLLKAGGRLVVISFHSGEDAVVKDVFRNWEKGRLAKVMTKKPVMPSEAERLENPRARSAKLRVIEKL